MSIILYLMNEKGKKVLEKLCDTFNSQVILLVVGSRDPSVQHDYYTEIQQVCNRHNITFIDRKEQHQNLNHATHIAIGWRWMIPSVEKLIVMHDSLLPKYRGFSPLVSALINAEPEVGVTVLFASDRYDCGDIIAQRKVQIQYPITIAQAIKKVVPLYENLAVDIVKSMDDNSLETSAQNDQDASYSIWRDEDDYHIDWNDSAKNIIRFIDAVGYPYLGAFSWIGCNKVRVVKAVEVYDVKLEQRHAGKVIFIEDDSPVIITGKGLVKIMELLGSDGSNILPLKYFRTRLK